MTESTTYDLAIFVPVARLDDMTPAVQEIDGPTVSADDWFALRMCPADSSPLTFETEPTYRAAHFSAATDEQKQLIVECGVEGVAVVMCGLGMSFIQAAASINLVRVPDEE